MKKDNLFSNSKLDDVVLQEMQCKKIKAPGKGAILDIQIFFDLKLGEIKTKKSFGALMSIKIKCNEDGKNEEERLFSLLYNIKAKYLTSKTKTVIQKKLYEETPLFINELYLFTREDINNALNKMKIKFQLPYSIPGEIKIVSEPPKKEKTKTKTKTKK